MEDHQQPRYHTPPKLTDMALTRKANEGKLSPAQEATAVKIAARIIKTQIRVANYLNHKTAHFSRLQKTVLLLTLSTLFSALSLYLIFNAII